VSQKKALDLLTRSKALQEIYEGALSLYGEPKAIKAEEFIGYFATFLVELENALTKVELKAEKERKTKEKALAKVAADKAPSGEFDNVLSDMKNGRLYRKSLALSATKLKT